MDQSTNFVLPHWIYWGWLAIMPLVFMWISKGARIAELEPKDSEYERTGLTRFLDWTSNASVSSFLFGRSMRSVSTSTK